MKRVGWILAAAALLSAQTALAQTSSTNATKAPPQLAPMKVVHVKSSAPGCAPNCPEWISAEGMIDDGTLEQFKKVFKELGTRKLPILIDSGGGLVEESLAIGHLIRAKGLDVAVTKTVIVPCAGSDAPCNSAKSKGIYLGRPRAYLARCASSCAFILAAGARRFVGPTTFVGVHQLKTLQTSAQLLRKYRIETRTEWGIPVEVRRVLVSEKRVNETTSVAKTPDSAYAKVAKYFAEMGVTPAVMPILKSAPNSSIHWMTRDELKLTAIATDMIDGEALVFGKPSVPQVNSRFDAFKHFGSSPAQPAAPAN